ncbi:MAG: PBSX family phage terminase large subunit [Caulobacteraceae bacterium]|nr:PBSX family phage terminase large subunit [Caulobacteraceae bacterium]
MAAGRATATRRPSLARGGGAEPVGVRPELPARARFLYQSRRRYKVLYGGRGGAKSWSAARALLLRAADEPIRILCAREHQTSIRDSVHRLLVDQISALGLRNRFRVTREAIHGRCGSSFVFAGLKHNIDNIRSKEGFDVCWVEEAQSVSRHSWETLIPTIRKDGSEIWVTFNPVLEEDDTWIRFVVQPPANATVIKLGLEDNPHCPQVLRDEADDLKRRDPDAWAHIWGGQCRRMLEGAVYGAELARARDEDRLTSVPWDSSAPVHCFWDLGWADSVCVWMAQSVGLEFRIIDFLQGSQKPIDWYVAQLNRRAYVWGEDWLPHDARAQVLAAAGRTIESQLRSLGRRVRIVEKHSVADGINAARAVFGRCWFDQQRCADGLHALRHYRYEVGDDGRLSGRPLHDWASHAADAFRYLAVSLQSQRPRPSARDRPDISWMG